MNLPVFAIRPEPGCAATVEAGRAVGLAIEPCPLSEIRSLPWDPPRPEEIGGLLLGSANAVRYGGSELGRFSGKPAYAVGEATAKAAQAAGFPVAAMGEGGLQSLLDGLAGTRLSLLRLAGAEHVPLIPSAGIAIETRIAYENVPLPLPEDVADRLRLGALILLHSAAAARHLAAECARLAIPRSAIALAALGPRIAACAGDGWRARQASAEPREAALLALARHMCHEPPASR